MLWMRIRNFFVKECMQLTGQVQTEESLETLICLYGLAMVLSGLQHQWFAVESGSVRVTSTSRGSAKTRFVHGKYFC